MVERSLSHSLDHILHTLMWKHCTTIGFALFLLTGTGWFAIWAIQPPRPAVVVTMERLLHDMADMQQLAEFPEPAYQTHLYSSFQRSRTLIPEAGQPLLFADRGQALYEATIQNETPLFSDANAIGQAPAAQLAQGTKVGLGRDKPVVGDYIWVYVWSANTVGMATPQQGYVAKAALQMLPQGAVLAEMDGPGCIVRIWSANPSVAGKIRIYLDHAPQPTIETTFLDLLNGNWSPANSPAGETSLPSTLAGARGRGFNLYFPISFARHCRVVVDHIAELAYQINIRSYAPSTLVEPFSWSQLHRLRPQIDQLVKNHLQTLQPLDAETLATARVVTLPTQTLKAGGSLVGEWHNRTNSPGALVQMDWHLDAEHPSSALNCTVLRIWFDDGNEPMVTCPLGDFFGTHPSVQPFASLPMEVISPGLLRSRWVMPWKHKAHWQLENLGSEPLTLRARFVLTDRPWTDRSMHFFARGQSLLHAHTGGINPKLKLHGQGLLAGIHLRLSNPRTDWWGPFSETITTDDARSYGTGMDACFGFAWGDTGWFQHAYHQHARPEGPGHSGLNSCKRFFILDALPFRQSASWLAIVPPSGSQPPRALTMVYYGYLSPGGKVEEPPLQAESSTAWPVVPHGYRLAGALEGEHLRLLQQSQLFPVQEQLMPEANNAWSGQTILVGKPRRRGDWVNFALPVVTSGVFRVRVHLARGPEMGIIRLSLNDQSLGELFDGFHEMGLIPSGAVDFGTVRLTAGTAVLRLAVVGHHPKATGEQWMWGLDAIELIPIQAKSR